MTAERRSVLRAALERAAQYLPAQAPIRRFVHHNTLHHFETMRFEDALVEASKVFGAEPFLREERYAELLRRGRFGERQLEAVLAEEGVGDEPLFPGGPGERALRVRRLAHPPPAVEAIRWLVFETELLRTPWEGSPLVRSLGGKAAAEVEGILRALWSRCEALVRARPIAPAPEVGPRLRDGFVAAELPDPDDLVNPFLSRVLAAYLDQGVAYWPMPREASLYASFRRLYAQPAGAPDPWRAPLRAELLRQASAGLDAEAVALEELERLDAPTEAWEALLTRTLLALPGWGGMVRQLEQRPDLAPVEGFPVKLLDLLAIRLVLDRLAFEHQGVASLGERRPEALRASLRSLRRARATQGDVDEATLQLFVLAQLAGLTAESLDDRAAAALVRELEGFDALARRRVYQLAYERRLVVDALEAVASHLAAGPATTIASPEAQLCFCIDDREESIRRHLEELDPAIETYAFAAFYGIAMLYQKHGDARARPLCPAGLEPKHKVVERPLDPAGAAGIDARRGALGRLRHELRVGNRTLVRGGLLSAIAQVEAAPLLLRALFPRAAERLANASGARLFPKPGARAAFERGSEGDTVDGLLAGFSVEEMTGIVENVLSAIGLTERFAPLVVIFGHGSTNVNNPHEAAYDCGACGGSKGAPNGRVFALMANHRGVRARLAARGVVIPEATWFVGGYHDTASEEVLYFDLDALPSTHRARFAELRETIDRARALDAHERCRRFEHVGLDASPDEALRHVEARSADLGQPRPELGHATNFLCVVGRREATRGLFFDRRAFLCSYDPDRDPSGRILEGVLRPAIPVCAGINLEYFFSSVDPVRYGCGSKLPQNVSALLGVMDGHASDLRTGLPWQMVEIHEPLRLLTIVEAPVDRLRAAIDALPESKRLVENGWVHLVALDPADHRLYRFGPSGYELYRPTGAALATAPRSTDWYRGHRDHLPFARITAALAAPRMFREVAS
jgi:uncharacterized protein YbcC (UPF0753/DUF2309 family)